jgi:hypothetical protein
MNNIDQSYLPEENVIIEEHFPEDNNFENSKEEKNKSKSNNIT